MTATMMPDRHSGSNNCGQIEAAPEEADTVRPVKVPFLTLGSCWLAIGRQPLQADTHE
jgi:hypothetical protein